jgi:hypothetical protein
LFKHEGYEPVFMPVDASSGERRVKLMVPRMKLFFCFFVGESLQAHAGLPNVQLTTEEVVVRGAHAGFPLPGR